MPSFQSIRFHPLEMKKPFQKVSMFDMKTTSSRSDYGHDLGYFSFGHLYLPEENKATKKRSRRVFSLLMALSGKPRRLMFCSLLTQIYRNITHIYRIMMNYVYTLITEIQVVITFLGGQMLILDTHGLVQRKSNH